MLGNRAGLRLYARNPVTLQKQSAKNAYCVRWVLRNITDPEVADSAIRLAGNIRWFDGSSKNEPPFDWIASLSEGWFDSTK